MKEISLADGSLGTIDETGDMKIFLSSGYSFAFDKRNGTMARWGKTLDNDPDELLGLPEIADIEISTICKGVGKVCSFCYKSNTARGTYMPLFVFEQLLDKLPPTITQIAFGIGDIQGNPDLWDIMKTSRNRGIVPNITINGADFGKEEAEKLASLCGAVAVSYYDHQLTKKAVSLLKAAGLEQVNIHAMLSQQTLDQVKRLLLTLQTDFKGLRALVFLSLKQKGRAKSSFSPVTQEEFTELVSHAYGMNVPLGFDSCGAAKYAQAIRLFKPPEEVERDAMLIEPCEAAIFSSYFNVKGEYFPCSFMEEEEGWEEGLDTLSCQDFIKDIWWHPKTVEFRRKVKECRGKISCPHFNI